MDKLAFTGGGGIIVPRHKITINVDVMTGQTDLVSDPPMDVMGLAYVLNRCQQSIIEQAIVQGKGVTNAKTADGAAAGPTS